MKFVETTKNGKPLYKIDGKVVTKAVFDREMEAARPKVASRPKKLKPVKRGYPFESMSIVVHPDDRQKAMDMATRMGVPTEYNHNGSAIIRDAQHQKALMKVQGLHHRNCFN